jgi:hypothetical protein
VILKRTTLADPHETKHNRSRVREASPPRKEPMSTTEQMSTQRKCNDVGHNATAGIHCFITSEGAYQAAVRPLHL